MRSEELAFVLRCESALGTSLELEQMCTHFLSELVRGSIAIGGGFELHNGFCVSIGKTCDGQEAIEFVSQNGPKPFFLGVFDSGIAQLKVELKHGALNLFFKKNSERLSFYGNVLSGIANRVDTSLEACLTHGELQSAQAKLESLNTSLEQKVEERTAELHNALSELQLAQNEILQQEKLAVLGELAAGVAHEMNTPLGAIISSAENLSTILKWMFNDGLKSADHGIITEACRLADGFIPHETLTSRKERAERKLLTDCLVNEYGIGEENASTHARTLVECGVLLSDKPVLEHIYGSDNPALALEITATVLKIRKSIGNIESAAQRAANVVRALKSYVRNENVQSTTVFDVKRSINDVLLLFSNQIKKGVELHLDLDAQMMLQGNESELGKVWSNLIANALYAMQYKGNLWITGTTDDKHVVLNFTNDGPTIPPEVVTRLFEPFYTTKPRGEGSGMGLGIVFNVVTSMDGSVEVESGVTTTFKVVLPKAKIDD